MTSINPDEVYKKIVKVGDEWADAQYVAELMEETRKTVLSQLMADSAEKSIAARETEALASSEYREHVEKMVMARKTANRAKVRYDSVKIWCELKRTESANERATLRSAP